MTFLLTSPGSPLTTGPGMRLLINALPAGSAPPAGTFSGPYPSAIPGLAGWWDAGLLTGLRDANGQTLTASNGAVASVADKSGEGVALAPYHIAVNTTPATTLAVARINGFLGAVGAPASTIASYGAEPRPGLGAFASGI